MILSKHCGDINNYISHQKGQVFRLQYIVIVKVIHYTLNVYGIRYGNRVHYSVHSVY